MNPNFVDVVFYLWEIRRRVVDIDIITRKVARSVPITLKRAGLLGCILPRDQAPVRKEFIGPMCKVKWLVQNLEK
jgi:uncharacterized ferredoxin-like protein